MCQEQNNSEFKTDKEAAVFLRTSSITLWRDRRFGKKIPYYRAFGRILYRQSDLEKFLADHKRNAEK